uniref:Uncharacterized protein n=1 Tax=Physcomitrium patens TaxID=3218 RepID=A0A2K1JVU6_PHYPA|nr:hypothetical protein PHYPA_015419 [Physcomitrium patens]
MLGEKLKKISTYLPGVPLHRCKRTLRV